MSPQDAASDPSGTHLLLDHAGLTPQATRVFEIMNGGWRRMQDSMQRMLDSMV